MYPSPRPILLASPAIASANPSKEEKTHDLLSSVLFAGRRVDTSLTRLSQATLIFLPSLCDSAFVPYAKSDYNDLNSQACGFASFGGFNDDFPALHYVPIDRKNNSKDRPVQDFKRRVRFAVPWIKISDWELIVLVILIVDPSTYGIIETWNPKAILKEFFYFRVTTQWRTSRIISCVKVVKNDSFVI